jgi:hypothetical protein
LPIDPNLVEILAREVLEEKIASMIYNSIESLTEKSKQQPPQHSPRKSLEFLEQQRDPKVVLEFQTPQATPRNSPPPSPPPQKEEPKVEPIPVTEKAKPEVVKYFIIEKDEDSYSVLDVTLEDEAQHQLLDG